eukprot:TRINITY_DN1138_c0_g1_i2.p1 TRINITY_DN1138_c0_g1~~TRINITY_DN1138_c0_g1_i2.p1  ORF type:complete len:239 (-),score=113.67 TRINITY_DN1138_c0_g1_i2:138-794(-)
MMAEVNQSKIVLYYGNKDASASITNLEVTVPNTPKLRLQVKPAVVPEVAPKQQVQQFYLCQCMQPFDEPPQLEIQFQKQGQTHTLSLALPVLLTKFTVPLEFQPQDFVATWKTMSNEIIEIFRARNPIDVTAIRNSLQQGMGMFLLDGLDKNPANIVCSGTFHTATKNPQGEDVTIPMLLRIETNERGQGFRVTIRSGHKLVSDAIKKAMLKVFGVSQ